MFPPVFCAHSSYRPQALLLISHAAMEGSIINTD